jgi:hypothetical protein
MSKPKKKEGPSWPWSYGSWIYNYLCNQCLSPLMLWVRISIKVRCTTLCDQVCQWLATGRWFSPVSSTNKTNRHGITEILLKVALSTIKQTNKQTKRIRTNKNLQNITQKSKDRATRTPLKTGVNAKCTGRVRSRCSTCGTSVVVDKSWRRKEPDCDYDKRKISSSFLVSSILLSKTSWYEPQALECRINWKRYRKMYTICRCCWNAATHGKFTMVKLKSSLLW